jgi:hypothetical protein
MTQPDIEGAASANIESAASANIEGAASANMRVLKCTGLCTYLTKDITQKYVVKLSH